MNDDETRGGEENLTPAEERLSEHLELLRASPPTPGTELIARLIRKVRWQRVIRDPLVLAGAVARAVGESLRLLLKPPADPS